MKLVFFTNLNKPNAADMMRELTSIAAGRGAEVYSAVESDELYDLIEGCCSDAFCVVTLGGDGTVLRAVSAASKRGIPVLGVNMGRVGFFSEISAAGFNDALTKLENGDYYIENAAMLTCLINGEIMGECLNDFSIHRQELASITHIGLSVDGDDVGDVMADGLIVATTSGSTAYTMSAGGPVVAPKLDCILVTPICPHSLTVRPIVTSSESVIRVEVKCTCRLSGDGNNLKILFPGDEAVFTRASRSAGFIRFNKRNVFRLIREKLM